MDELASRQPRYQAGRVFLCHNRQDSDFVRIVAEVIELEFGLPHFLDCYAIPPGEEFLKLIDEALSTCASCMIFLSKHGWGPTHLLEAEKAVTRYRSDAEFRLIPAVIGSVDDADLLKLAQGAVFKKINWIEFTRQEIAKAQIQQIGAAILGENPTDGRGPAELTPYLIRRNATQWKTTQDTSLLYRGKLLVDAQQVAVENAPLMGPDVLGFLSASAAAAKKRTRNLGSIATIIAVTLGVLSSFLYLENETARSRELAALALASDDKSRGLLLAIAAHKVKPTFEARASLFELLNEVSGVTHYLHGFESGIRSVDINARSHRVVAGGEDGHIAVWDLSSPAQPKWETDFAMAGGTKIDKNRVHAVRFLPEGDRAILALEYGGLVIWHFETGAVSRVQGWPEPSDGTSSVFTRYYGPDPESPSTAGERAVTSLNVDRSAHRAVAADHAGRVALVDTMSSHLIWMAEPRGDVAFVGISVADGFIVSSDSKGTLTMNNLVGDVIDVSDRTVHQSRLLAMEPVGDQIVSIDRLGQVAYWSLEQNDKLVLKDRQTLSISPIAAAIDPDQKRLVLTITGGVLYEIGLGESKQTPMAGHRLTAASVACDQDDVLCVSGGVGGELVLWNPSHHSLLLSHEEIDADLINDIRSIGTQLEVVTSTVHEQLKEIESNVFTGDHQIEIATYPLNHSSATQSIRLPHHFVGIANRDDIRGVLLARENVEFYRADNPNDPLVFTTDRGEPGRLHTLAWSDNYIAAADNLSSLWVWRFDHPGKPIHYAKLDMVPNSLVFTPDERYLMLSDLKGRVVRLSIETKVLGEQHTALAADGPIFAMVFDKRAQMLIGSGAADREIRIWDVESMSQTGIFPSVHKGSISALELSPNGEILVSMDDTGAVNLWDYQTRRLLGNLPHPPDTIFQDVAFSSNGSRLITASDNELYTWAIDLDDLIQAARRIANREIEYNEWSVAVGGVMP